MFSKTLALPFKKLAAAADAGQPPLVVEKRGCALHFTRADGSDPSFSERCRLVEIMGEALESRVAGNESFWIWCDGVPIHSVGSLSEAEQLVIDVAKQTGMSSDLAIWFDRELQFKQVEETMDKNVSKLVFEVEESLLALLAEKLDGKAGEIAKNLAESLVDLKEELRREDGGAL